MSTTEQHLATLGIELPTAASPVANYVQCVRSGNLLFVSGQISFWNAEPTHTGKVGRDLSTAEGAAAARICALNTLAQAKAFLGTLDRVGRVCMLQGLVNAIPEFTEHPQVINGASNLFVECLGERGKHARLAVGVGSLPLNAAVEIAVTLEVT
jgi:enamine deaminase RidA (YjgF/YER057c/UK114 family)